MRVVVVRGGVGGLACAQRLARRSTLEELTDWTLWSDKTLVF